MNRAPATLPRLSRPRLLLVTGNPLFPATRATSCELIADKRQYASISVGQVFRYSQLTITDYPEAFSRLSAEIHTLVARRVGICLDVDAEPLAEIIDLSLFFDQLAQMLKSLLGYSISVFPIRRTDESDISLAHLSRFFPVELDSERELNS